MDMNININIIRLLKKDRRVKHNSNQGFTLVELIVVLVILAILAAIMVPTLLGYIDRAKQQQAIMDAQTIVKAVKSEAAIAYGKGHFKIEGTGAKLAKLTETDIYPSLKGASRLIYNDFMEYGNPGNDALFRYGVVYNGFGGDPNNGDTYYKKRVYSKKHFVVLMSERAEILKMTYCDGTYVVTYTQENGYTVQDSTCKKQASGNETIYNYICVTVEPKKGHLDPKEVYEKIIAGPFFKVKGKDI